jgi:hypothetical protein
VQQQISAITLSVSDVSRLRRFYVDALVLRQSALPRTSAALPCARHSVSMTDRQWCRMASTGLRDYEPHLSRSGRTTIL